MPEPRTAHTSDLTAAELATIRALLDDAFGDRFTDDDWDHAVGGIHAMVWEDGVLLAHGSLVQRRLLHGGRALRTGYVEAVAVRADRRREGLASAVMAALEGVLLRGAYELGALGASEVAARLYTGRGWHQWRGPLSVLAPSGMRRIPEEAGSVYVLPVAAPGPDLDGELVCDWRPGDVW
ncbi:GNAT family N-acetyltransferase [Streptomyces sp. NPDC037389]|uniref:GNAT family N-acetyltransferase n=1 Tax=Streptomyces sp. NPDC037389 TaxID=3155369 RepID=UPI00340B6A8F